VHAHGNDANRARMQFGRMCAHVRTVFQPGHVAVASGGQIMLEVFGIPAQIGIGDAGVGETEFSRPLLDVVGKRGVVDAGSGGGHASIVDAVLLSSGYASDMSDVLHSLYTTAQ